MGQDFSTTGPLASIRRRGMIPATDEALSSTDLLALATEELQTYVMDLLVSAREEYRVADYDVAIVSGTAEYRIPSRAAGDSLRNVKVLDSSGAYVPLLRVEPERVHEYGSSTGSPAGYYFKGNDVVLVPTPSASGTLRLEYHRRPSALVATSAAATISSINGDRTVITTTATIPSTIVSGISVDVVDNTPGFKTLVMDGTTTATTSGTTITLTSALPSSVAAGDYVCLAGESPVAQIPVELHPLLAQRTKAAALEALGDPKAVLAQQVADRMRQSAMVQLSPRSKGSPRYLINRNAPGLGRRRR